MVSAAFDAGEEHLGALRGVVPCSADGCEGRALRVRPFYFFRLRNLLTDLFGKY
jgi:hypothetical protein